MSKKITIKEEDVEEPYEEIIEQVDNTPELPDVTSTSSAKNAVHFAAEPPPPPPEKQKAECKMRMRELYKCDDCGKYLTKKSLNYSHYKTCRGKPENKIKPDVKPQAPPPQAPPPEPVQQMTPPPVYYQQVPRQIPIYEQMRLEKQRAHLEKIQRLSMFIA